MTRVLVPLAMAVLVVACATVRDRSPQDGRALENREWTVQDVGGRGVVDDSHVTLVFGPRKRLSGSGGCNRLIGSYTREGAALAVARPGMTMMACAPALMEQERRFVDLLSRVRRFSIDPSGALSLTTDDGSTITAR